MISGSLGISCPKLDADRARAAQRERLTGSITRWADEIVEADERRVQRRDRAKTAMESAAAELAKTGPAKVPNSDAVALAVYVQALGFAMDADTLNELLVLLAVLVIECGGGLALAVGMALSDGRTASGDLREDFLASNEVRARA